MGFSGGSEIKNPTAMKETWVWYLGGDDPLEKEMATQSSILTWKFYGQRNLVGYSPRGCKGVRHDLATKQQWLGYIGVCVCVCARICMCSVICSFLFVALCEQWTIVCQALLCPWDFPGKGNRVGCYYLHQGIFPTQGSTLVSSISCIGGQILYHCTTWGSPVHVCTHG